MEIYRMKKSLFAVAALSAIAGTAQAQSSVTVYGILDVGYQGSNLYQTTVNTTTGNNQVRTTTNAIAASGEQTSRLGFRGTEDLGGGKSAFFTIELGLNPMLGNLSGGSTVNDTFQGNTNGSGSAIDNRQTFAGLKQNGVGQFALGRQYTPIFNSGAATSPGQYNNIQGDVVYVGSTNGNNGMANLTSFTNRADSALTVQSDTFAGFKVSGMYAIQNSTSTLSQQTNTLGSTQGGGNINWNGYGLGLDYTWKKLYVTAATQSFREQYTNNISATSATVLNVGGANPNSGQITATGTVLSATNLRDKQNFVGGTYDFGILKAYAQWTNRQITQNYGWTTSNPNAGAATLTRSAQQIGVRSYITPTVEAWASGGNGVYRGANYTAVSQLGSIGNSAVPIKFVAYQLGANYWLSKRTNLYGIFGAQSSSTTAQGSAAAASGAASSNQYALGLRHTF